jgi:glycosyltransferase involved in cell wall biosynthesis
MSVLFTVAIPAYKAKFLKECVDSILIQGYTNFELIIVNDASPENIDEIVRQYSDGRISYFVNKKNIGAENVVDNWNKCLSYANGDYFVLMGDDDVMESNYLEEFARLIKKYPDLDIYHCRSYIINENSEKVMITPSWPAFESVYENIWHRISSLRIQFISDFVYRRDSLVDRGGFYKLPLAWASDDISAYIAMQEKGIAHLNKPVFNYRKSSLTISLSVHPDLKMKAILLEESWFKTFLKNKKPQIESDKILYSLINKRLRKYILRKKSNVITFSLNAKGFIFLLFWMRKIRIYDISISLFLYSLIKFYKAK